MSKETKITVIVLLMMFMMLSASFHFTADDLAYRSKVNMEAIFSVMRSGDLQVRYNMSDIQKMGETTFDVTLEANGHEQIKNTYQGVLLKSILEKSGADFAGKSKVLITSVDGYVVTIEIDKLMADDNVYLTYMKNNELFENYGHGGRGPYLLIVRQDDSSQFWCNNAYSVDLK